MIRETSAEIAHEALITQWPWLQERIQESAGDIRALGRLIDSAGSWEVDKRNPYALPHAAMRAEFEVLRTRHPRWLSASETGFLDAAGRRARREWLMWRAVAAALALLTVGMGAFGWREAMARQDAEMARKEAVEEKKRADDATAEAQNQAARAQQEAESARQARQQAEHQTALAQREAWLSRRNQNSVLTALSTAASAEGRPVEAAKLALMAWPRNAAGENLNFGRRFQRRLWHSSTFENAFVSKAICTGSQASPSPLTGRSLPPGSVTGRHECGTSRRGQSFPVSKAIPWSRASPFLRTGHASPSGPRMGTCRSGTSPQLS
nr:hypothetical protein [Paracoccus sp. J39]